MENFSNNKKEDLSSSKQIINKTVSIHQSHHIGPSNKFIISLRFKRFLNFILDIIFYFIFLAIIASIIWLFIAIVWFSDTIIKNIIQNTNYPLFWIIVFFVYFIVAESIRWKTLAKFITRTKVINKHWDKPNFLNIFWRTLCRFIPFEAFSFLVSSHPRGWHDSISKTYVVDDK